LSIVGIDCVWEAQHNVEQAFNDHSLALATIVLAHEPDIADEVARYNPLLQLSGHTHGGHFALPILGPAFLPRHGFRYFRGIQRVGDMWLYVSRGVGGFPLRLGSTPEVTIFTLHSAKRDQAAVK
jgi:predicted MPP superfamily phosphohydrolase